MSTQTQIPGTEDPDHVPEIEERLATWLEAKERAKDASDSKKTAEHLLLVELQERGVDRYPYMANGKRRYFVADRTPKAKTIAAPSKKQEGRVDRAIDKLIDAIPDGTKLTVTSGGRSATVESRRVTRTAAHDAVSDPFATTRGAMK